MQRKVMVHFISLGTGVTMAQMTIYYFIHVLERSRDEEEVRLVHRCFDCFGIILFL